MLNTQTQTDKKTLNAQTQPQTQNTDIDTNTRILAAILLGLLMNSNPEGLYKSDAVMLLESDAATRTSTHRYIYHHVSTAPPRLSWGEHSSWRALGAGFWILGRMDEQFNCVHAAETSIRSCNCCWNYTLKKNQILLLICARKQNGCLQRFSADDQIFSRTHSFTNIYTVFMIAHTHETPLRVAFCLRL
jgi:hypothetical protein